MANLLDLTQSPVLGAVAQNLSRKAQKALQWAGVTFCSQAAVWMVLHFIFGRGRDVSLENEVPLTGEERGRLRENAQQAIGRHLLYPKSRWREDGPLPNGVKYEIYQSLVGIFSAGVEYFEGQHDPVESSLGWFTSLAGVIGCYNIALEVRGNVIVALCRDHWDFNGRWDPSMSEEDLEWAAKKTTNPISLPTEGMEKWLPTIRRACGIKGVKIFEEPGRLWFNEGQLGAVLNDQHGFWTRWEFEFTPEELGLSEGWNDPSCPNYLILKDGGNVAYLRRFEMER